MSTRKRSRVSGSARRGQQAASHGNRWAKAHRGRVLVGLGGLIVVAVIVAIAAAGSAGRPATTGAGATPGAAAGDRAVAPDGSFTTTAGATRTVASLHGQPTLLWFVTTWCSSCQAGTQAMSREIPALAARHVRVVELELSGDLGQPGPAISDFARRLAGGRYDDPDWTFGTASPALTHAYDPSGYLDVYYLIDAAGHITYANSSPAATMRQLLSATARIAPHA